MNVTTQRRIYDWTWAVGVKSYHGPYKWDVLISNVQSCAMETRMNFARWRIDGRILLDASVHISVRSFIGIGPVCDWINLVRSGKTVHSYSFHPDDGPPLYPLDLPTLAAVASEARKTLSGYALLDWLRESALPVVPSILSDGEVTWPGK